MKERRTSPLNKIPKFVYVFLGILLFSVIIYVIALISPSFADFFNRYPGAAVRAVLAFLTNAFPFSLAEIFIISIPALIALVAILAYKKYCFTWRSSLIFTVSILSCLSIFFSVFALGFGTGYHGTGLDEKLRLDKKAVAPEELEATAVWLAGELNDMVDEISYKEDNFSEMPHSISEMNGKLMDAYEKVCDEYGFIQDLHSKVKPVILSKAMSYTHITGVYTYFTGEANLNVNFPDYTLPYTAAHELAHQRGIAREDEANFIAFLVCDVSDDIYVRYSGYLNLYEYVASALSAQPEAYKRVRASLDPRIINEMKAYSSFFDKYRHSTAGKVSETVNNTYLQVQGTVGTKSYGMVVDLAVAYYLSENS